VDSANPHPVPNTINFKTYYLKNYSQLKALWAITIASFRAIFSQPSSIFFSFLFPIVFILIFGAFSDRPADPFKIAIDENSDKSSALFDSLSTNPLVKIVQYKDTAVRNSDLRKGKLTAILLVKKIPGDSTSRYIVSLQSSQASNGNVYQLMKSLDYQALKIELHDAKQLNREYTVLPQIVPGKKYRSIDFILPGMLGFSVLFATLFGISFLFFNLREQLVLKRFYASPVHRISILVGIGVSRLFYQLINLVVLILFGHFFMKFTLVHGAITFFEMLAFSLYMLFLLMGVGLVISSIAKSDTMIPLMINVFGFPQMLLSGTFFSLEVFPKWMQNLCQLLPLTQFNNAMRKISFEGLHFYDCWREIGFLGIWMIVVYATVIKVMKWE
jgi:ABC-2 type transport system permease protein